ncbi:MAG TPA: DUF2442 domain-containing protein [Candidatus Acidoferrum sp.]|nr:DUF2442 domain-containing protein [Candidatus Acidoferrum sp.]
MRIADIKPKANWILDITADDGCRGHFDMKPYLEFEAFAPLKDQVEFCKISNGGYFVEWVCGADLSADTIEAHWKIIQAAA